MAIVNNRQLAEKARRFSPASRETLGLQIAARLGDAIRSGELPAGARLTEKSIADEMQTSRGPIREALRQLAELGLIQIRPHRGAVVSLPDEAELADMVLMRALLEGAAARLIAGRDADFSTLTDIVAKMAGLKPSRFSQRLRMLDWQFHSEIVRLSGSVYLEKFWNMMRDGLNLIMSSGRNLYEKTEGVAQSHAEMVEVLRSEAPAEAERYFRKRLMDSGFRWLGKTAPDL